MAIEEIKGVRCRREALEPFVEALLSAGGADAASASAVARAVVDASSRGVDTHGVRLAPWYVSAARDARVNRSPRIVFTRKAPAVGHVHADLGFGHLGKSRRCAKHFVVNPGQGGDKARQRQIRIYQRLEFIANLAARNARGAQFDHPRRDRLSRDRFDVEHRLSLAGELAVEGRETRVWATRDTVDLAQTGDNFFQLRFVKLK